MTVLGQYSIWTNRYVEVFFSPTHTHTALSISPRWIFVDLRVLGYTYWTRTESVNRLSVIFQNVLNAFFAKNSRQECISNRPLSYIRFELCIEQPYSIRRSICVRILRFFFLKNNNLPLYLHGHTWPVTRDEQTDAPRNHRPNLLHCPCFVTFDVITIQIVRLKRTNREK